MWTGVEHDDVAHMQEFRDRWEFVKDKSGRPNIMTFSNNQGRYFTDTSTTPDEQLWLPEGDEGVDFLLLADHNRSSLPFSTERIGSNKRMINGNMRSYHIADKLSTTVNWDNLPSRAYSTLGGYQEWLLDPDRNAKFTVDGGAGGNELLKWWQEHHGSFWVFFSVDAVPVPLPDVTVFQGYARVYEMQITDFDYEIVKRSPGIPDGSGNVYYLDLWNVSLTLEEV